MIKILKTSSGNPDFIDLVKLLDADTKGRDGEDHSFHVEYNKIDILKYVLIAYLNDAPVGCGAIKNYDETTMEIKRMYVLPEARGNGIASKVLAKLEKWAKELSFNRCILETGKMYPEARALYHKSGYRIIANYDQYVGIENSMCFEKSI